MPKFVYCLGQNLVISSYRRLFSLMASHHPELNIGLGAPRRFKELGLQICSFQSHTHDHAFRQLDVFPVSAPHTQIVFYWGLARALRNFFKGSAPQERLIVCIAEPYSITALLVLLVAKIFVGRCSCIFMGLQNIHKNFPLPLRWSQAFVFKHAAAMLSIGKEQTEVLRSQGYKGQIIYCPMWFNEDMFQLEEKQDSLSTRYRLGYVGALSEAKGIPDLIAALEGLRDLEICVQFAGRGPLEGKIRSYCDENQNSKLQATFLGALDQKDTAALMQRLDLLVVPSRTMAHWKEQFGRVIVEAQACGATVIGSNSGAIPEVIADEQLIFPEGDVAAISAKIRSKFTEWQARSADERLKERRRLREKSCQLSGDRHVAERLVKEWSYLTP